MNLTVFPPPLEALSSLNELLEIIQNHTVFTLTTHKSSDGDGIGSAIALYWALIQMGKEAQFRHVDPLPRRYNFLTQNTETALFEASGANVRGEVLLVTDTNQGTLCDPIYSHFRAAKKKIVFIDHHLRNAATGGGAVQTTPLDDRSDVFHIRTEASSTGEVVYDILECLHVKMTIDIARAIYTSITFDTQAFKLLRNSSKSHEIAAVLAKNNIQTDQIQRELFATWTVQKMNFFSQLIQNTTYSHGNAVAGFCISMLDLKKYQLELDQVSDLLDMFTLIKTVNFCYGMVEIEPGEYKLSFRSIDSDQAFKIAQMFGGGGHAKSSGAWVCGERAAIEKRILSLVQ